MLLRIERAGRSFRPAHRTLVGRCVAAGLALALVPAGVGAQVGPRDLWEAADDLGKSGRDVRAFYEAQNYRPLWVRDGTIGPEADRLLDLIETSDVEGLRPRDYKPRAIVSAIRKAQGGSAKSLAKAEMLLSQAFVDYVQAVRRPGDTGMLYVETGLAPAVPTAAALLRAAAAAPSLRQYLDDMGWMHPLYGKLRKALANPLAHGRTIDLLRVNLERARALPHDAPRRYVLVDAAAARLWMYEDGRVKDTMRVVVGKTDQQTPMMAGRIRFATVNPYWNIPPDLAATSVAPNVLSKGLTFLKTKRYEVLSDWSDTPKVLDPSKIDWKAVAAGQRELRIRQLPGKDNAMGRMKFMFPNDLGIYLHDTPERALLSKEARQFSSGCVRLEDAPRLARWLFGKPLAAPSKAPEQHVPVPEPVPIYITYLTVAPEGDQIAFRRDVYNRDAVQLARVNSPSFAGR